MRNVVFVATMNNSVYAFDADDPTNGFGPTDLANQLQQSRCRESPPYPAPTSATTPAIPGPSASWERRSSIRLAGPCIWLPAPRRTEPTSSACRLWISPPARRDPASPVAISACVTNQDGTTTVFDPKMETQRAALALANGRVYIAWASLEDIAPYQGWVIAYDATTLQQVGVFNTAPTGGMAGIWMSGQGALGRCERQPLCSHWQWCLGWQLPTSPKVFSSSVPSLALLDWFTPDNWQSDQRGGLGLGVLGAPPDPGNAVRSSGQQRGQVLRVGHYQHGPHGGGQYANPASFQASERSTYPRQPRYTGMDRLERWFTLARDRISSKPSPSVAQSFNTTPVSQSTFAAPPGMPGGFLSLSANGSASRNRDSLGLDAAVAGREPPSLCRACCALSTRPT